MNNVVHIPQMSIESKRVIDDLVNEFNDALDTIKHDHERKLRQRLMAVYYKGRLDERNEWWRDIDNQEADQCQ